MAYCTPEDVEGLMQARFTVNTRPSAPDADMIVDNIAADLDGIAQAAGYTVPVTATQAKALMKRYNTLGAACECWHSGWRSDAQTPPNVEYWCNTYTDFIKRLRAGEQQLPGINPESNTDGYFIARPQIPRDGWLTQSEELGNGD